MNLSVYVVADVIMALMLLLLAVFSIKDGGYKQKINRYFALFTVFVAIWIPSNHLSNNLGTPVPFVILADYLVFSCSFGAMILLMEIIRDLSQVKSDHYIKILRFIVWPTFFLSASPLVVAGVTPDEKVFAVNFGPLISVYGILLLVMIVHTIVLIIKGRRQLKGQQLKQLNIIGGSLSLSLPLVFLFSFILPSATGNFAFTEFGITPIIFIVGGLYYAVVKHQLFDIRSAAARSLAYILSLLCLIGLYFLLVYAVSRFVVGDSTALDLRYNVLNISISIILILVFQPIRRFFDNATEEFFFRNEYKQQEVLDKFGLAVIEERSVKSLVERSFSIINESINPKYIVCVINDHESKKYFKTGTISQIKIHEFEPMIKKIEENSELVIEALVAKDLGLSKTFYQYNVGLVMRMRVMKDEVGVIIIGDKKSEKVYTHRDSDMLSVANKELSVAFQNVLRFESIRQFNATLQERVYEATRKLRMSNTKLKALDETKDDFMSMASHQLRTPLTSIKGYISMLMDGDMGELKPMQRKALEEAYNSSQRMVYLIGDFLNLSRLKTGKFEIEISDVSLPRLIQEEIAQLRATADARGVSVVYDAPVTFPEIKVDETKIRQVMMNFIDNAVYYSKPSGGRVSIVLEHDEKSVSFRVIDNGIGVEKDEQKHLFTKFYRTPRARKARPDGTGIGIYMAKKVIDAHHGEVIFESQHDIGSTFGFRLPIHK